MEFILAPYYGYFPLSFNNLKVNKLNVESDYNMIGLSTFVFFYYSLLHLHHFFDIPVYAASMNRTFISSNSATVATGFWEFYYDFGIFLFLPISIMLIIAVVLLNKGNKENGITYKILYLWYIGLIFFQSFMNVVFGPSTIFTYAFIYMIFKNIFKINNIKKCSREVSQ